jgi:hypothetical protein
MSSISCGANSGQHIYAREGYMNILQEAPQADKDALRKEKGLAKGVL